MKRTIQTTFVASCVTSLVLTGCFSDDPEIKPEEKAYVVECEDESVESGLCQPKSNETLNWISSQLNFQADYRVYDDAVFAEAAVDTPALESDSSNDTQTIETSETNTVEEGVDEADWVKVINSQYLVTPKQPRVDYNYEWREFTEEEKSQCENNYQYDFEILPALEVDQVSGISAKSSPAFYWSWCDGTWELDNIDITKGELKVFEMIQTPASSQLASSLELNPYSNHISGLYDVLDDSGLLVLSSLSDSLPDMRGYYGWWHNKTGIDLIDVTDPLNPQAQWEIKLDGYVIDSRVLNDELVIVSRRSPYEIEQFRTTLINNASQDTTQEQVAQMIANMPVDKLMGTIQVNDNAAQTLAQLDQCLLPKDDRPSWGINFTYITKIDLTDPDNIQTICTLAPMHEIYMNQNALYLLTSDYNWSSEDGSYYKTNLDRFDLDSFSYSGSLNIDGTLGWGIDSKFRIKEQQLNEQDVLTLILSQRDNFDETHFIKNFAFENNEFTQLDVYPQLGEKAIGKPNESIRSARIDGTSVEIVTYLNTDPLYQFNISDPSNIWMESELIVTGFSTYLHKIEDTDLTIGVGFTDDWRLKIELFDQSGLESSVLGRIEMESRTSSPATNDYKAFTSYDDKDNQIMKIALPIQRWGYTDYTNGYNYTNMAGLWLIEVDYSQAPATITQINDIEMSDQARDVYQSRAVIRGSAVHYALNGEVYSTDFSSDSVVHSTKLEP